MKIYRLENKRGEGVYHGASLWSLPLKEDYNGGPGTRHPGPHRDTLFCENHLRVLGSSAESGGFSGLYVFGFNSPAQVLRWFFNRDDLATLEQEGFRLGVYECADVIEGNTQAAFGRWHQLLFTPVVTYGLVEFYDLFAGKSPTS